MIRIQLEIIYETEMVQFLSEKPLAQGGVTTVTLTSGNDFAAKNLPINDRKVFLR